jgi:hypothetical protein
MDSIYFSLNQPINTQKLVHSIIKLVQHQKEYANKILKVQIVSITSEDDAIPKIEYKSDEINI